MIADLSPLDEDPEFPCHDGGRHRFEHDGGEYVRCRRGCGAEVAVADLDCSPDPPEHGNPEIAP